MNLVRFIHLQRQFWAKTSACLSFISHSAIWQYPFPHPSTPHIPCLSICAPCCLFYILLHFGSFSRVLLAHSTPTTQALHAPQTGRQLADPLCCFLSSAFISRRPKKKGEVCGCGGVVWRAVVMVVVVGVWRSLPWSVYLWINEKLIISDKPELVPGCTTAQDSKRRIERMSKRKNKRKKWEVCFLFEQPIRKVSLHFEMLCSWKPVEANLSTIISSSKAHWEDWIVDSSVPTLRLLREYQLSPHNSLRRVNAHKGH